MLSLVKQVLIRIFSFQKKKNKGGKEQGYQDYKCLELRLDEKWKTSTEGIKGLVKLT